MSDDKDKPVVGHVIPAAGPGEKRTISVGSRITISEDVDVKTSKTDTISAPAPAG